MAQFHLQIHITGRCNCRCKHCYIAPNASELSVGEIESILKQYESLINRIRKDQKEVLPFVYITGGEPFLHRQIHEILALMKAYSDRFTFRIMTNGTVLGKELLEHFKQLSVPCLQVSIDGNEKTHDYIRGEGNFKRVLEGLDIMHANGILTRVSFTAHKMNYLQFPEVAEICRQHHVSALWSDRYVPCQASQMLIPLGKVEAKEYVEILETEKRNPLNRTHSLAIKNIRALQFLASGEYPYHCSAGISALAVDEKGEVYPCRKFALSCGNVFEQELEDIYYNNEILKTLRVERIPHACKSCRHKKMCQGGSRCAALASYGDYGREDPGCWLCESEDTKTGDAGWVEK